MTHFFSSARVWLLAGAAALAFTGHAQAQAQRPAAAAPGTITVKLMPLALADPWTPTFRFGAEYRLSAGWGVEASYGMQMRNLGWGADRIGRIGDHYRKLHAEARHYFAATPFYSALAGFVVSQRYEIGSGTVYQNEQQWAYSSAGVRRAVLGGLLKVGVVVPLFNDPHWQLDLAVGAGIRRVSVDYQMREAQLYQPQYDLLDCQPKCGFAVDLSPRTTPGTTLRPTVALDVRLGYALGR
jgi:hypothetical protein